MGVTGVSQVDLKNLRLVLILGDNRIKIREASPRKGGLVLGRISGAIFQDVDLLLSVVLRSVVDLAEGCRARLLVDRHNLPAEERIDEGRFPRIEITGDKDLRRSILDTRSEFVEMIDGAHDAVVQEIGDGRLFQLRYESCGRG